MPPKVRINRWVLEPLYAMPAFLSLLLAVTIILFVIGPMSSGPANATCVAFLAGAVAFAIGFIAFIIWKSRD